MYGVETIFQKKERFHKKNITEETANMLNKILFLYSSLFLFLFVFYNVILLTFTKLFSMHLKAVMSRYYLEHETSILIISCSIILNGMLPREINPPMKLKVLTYKSSVQLSIFCPPPPSPKMRSDFEK